MKKIIKQPILFQGEKQLIKQTSYFEGWYYKNTQESDCIVFIPGISINKNEKKAFIQVIIEDASYNIDYSIHDFHFSHDPFCIRIGNNYFYEDKIMIDINDNDLVIHGKLYYSDRITIKQTRLSPNIMGCFSYLPFMECNHAIIHMKAKVNGTLMINQHPIVFKDGLNYIEKDWGTSFPKTYIWMQANHFKDASFMFSRAHIPFGLFHFTGLICSLIVKKKEYRFATYNGARIIDEKMDKDSLRIVLKKGNLTLSIEASLSSGFELLAPIKGQMNKPIIESLSSMIRVTLKDKETILYDEISHHGGLEIVSN